jgi:hypothetical protein
LILSENEKKKLGLEYLINEYQISQITGKDVEANRLNMIGEINAQTQEGIDANKKKEDEAAAKKKQQSDDERARYLLGAEEEREILDETIRYRNMRERESEEERAANYIADTETYLAHVEEIQDRYRRQQNKEDERAAKERADTELKIEEALYGEKGARLQRAIAEASEWLKEGLISDLQSEALIAKAYFEYFKGPAERTAGGGGIRFIGNESAWESIAAGLSGGRQTATEETQKQIAENTKVIADKVKETTGLTVPQNVLGFTNN